MNDSKVLLKVEDFRAISQAEIKLDGITVVAGVNGCGKSTLSKLLYWVYRSATDFKVLADIQFRKDLEVVNKLVMLFVQTAQYHFLEEQNNNEITTNNIGIKIQRMPYMAEVMSILPDWHDLYRLKDVNEQDFIDFFDTVKQKLNKIGNEPYSAENIIKIFNDIFDEKGIAIKKTENISDVNIFDFLADLTNKIFDEHKENTSIKPRWFLDNQIKEIFHTKNLPNLLEISENEFPIFKTDYEFLSEPYWIDNVIYIDTPMFFQNYGVEHWNDVNEKLKKQPKYYSDKINTKEIDTLIKNEVLTGQAEIKFNELNDSFTFITPTGAEIDLGDGATGIKAFAVLSLLVKNKSINDKTLLILDEPEAHLHPQWIIEFGRLLTLIHKYIGAKIFVATHSPDMVQALRYIPNKEKIGEKVNFYLAKADENKNGQFIYQDLNGEIDDIFSSFNISLDKLAKYGED